MKLNFLAAAVLLTLSFPALSQHEAGGVPPRPDFTRELVTHGRHNGFMMPHVVERITIFSSGEVTLTRRTTSSSGQQSQDIILGTIAPALITQLATRIDAIDDNLVDLQDGQPYCTDAPAWTNTVYPSSVQSFVVSRWASCHEYVNENAEFIKSIMDGYLALAGIR
jgi:hypothetical protein